MNVVKLLSRSYQNYSEQEGSAHSTDNRYTALDEGHIPSSRIDPLTSTTANSLGDRPNLRREAQRGIPISDLTHHDRQLEVIGLETTHDGDIGGRGVMFDIRTKTEAKVRITSLTFHSHTIDMCKVKVFTKRGTHRSFEENSAAWTKIVDTTMECKGPGTASAITSSMFDSSLSDELIIEADIGRAIYIDSNNIMRYSFISFTNSEDKVFAEDSNVQIFEGTGLTRGYGDIHSPRMWNGLLSYELVASSGCAGMLTTPSNDSQQSYGHMFNIRSNYAGGIIIHGIEFQTHKTTKLNYEIRTIATTFMNNIGNSEWTLVAEGSVIGAGKGAATAIVGNNFTPVSIEEKTTRGFYITLDTEDLRYAESSGKVGEIFVQNNHISMEVGVGVADYPMGESFFLNRQWSGRVFYRTVNECPLPISVDYMYDVQWSKDFNSDAFLKKLSKIANTVVENFLMTNAEVKALEESGNSISLLSTETIHNTEMSSSCANTNDSELCNTLVSTVTVTAHSFSLSDTGYIKFLLLQQNQAVLNAIGSESITNTEIQLTAKYVGDEPIDTEIRLVLQGVKSSRMESEESAYLEEVIIILLNKNQQINSFGVEILMARVINVSIPPARLLRALVSNSTNMDDEGLDIVVDVFIGGMHRPPPDINFDFIVEDAINYDKDELRHDLASDSAYFQDVQEIANLVSNTISVPDSPIHDPSLHDITLNMPTPLPTQTPTSGDNDESGVIMIVILVTVSVAIVTFGLIFGAYMLLKTVRNKRKARTEQAEAAKPELFEEPMLDDWSQNSEDNVYNKKLSAATFKSGETGETMLTSESSSSDVYNLRSYPRDNEQERLTPNGVYGEQDGSYVENKKFYDHHRPSLDHVRPSYFVHDSNNSIISAKSGTSGRTGKSGRSRRSSTRTHSPSGRSKASSRRTNSSSGQPKTSSRRTYSPSDRSRASSRRSSSRRSSSRRRTHSHSDRSRTSSQNSPLVNVSTRAKFRNAEYGEGSRHRNYSTLSSKGARESKTSRNCNFKAVHGHNPPARRNRKSSRSFGSENEDEEKAGLVRMAVVRRATETMRYPISNNKSLVNDKASGMEVLCNRNEKIHKTLSDERSLASNSTNSTISTKGLRIPGKTYY